MPSNRVSEDGFPVLDSCEVLPVCRTSSLASTMLIPQSQNDIYSPTSSPRTRKRAVSLLSISSTHSSKIILDLPKTTPTLVLTICPGKHVAFGAFAPTSSASASLRSLVDSFPSRRVPFTLGLDQPRRKRRPKLVRATDYGELSESPSPPSSPISLPDSLTPSIPSISRTSSSVYVSRLLPYAPFPTAISSTLLDDPRLRQGRKGKNELNPILATLEKKSKLCTRRVHCATCKKSGVDYPKCSKCGEMWCSRECRLRGGNRHPCARTSRKC